MKSFIKYKSSVIRQTMQTFWVTLAYNKWCSENQVLLPLLKSLQYLTLDVRQRSMCSMKCTYNLPTLFSTSYIVKFEGGTTMPSPFLLPITIGLLKPWLWRYSALKLLPSSNRSKTSSVGLRRGRKLRRCHTIYHTNIT